MELDVLHLFSIKIIFYGKMDIRLFYFRVTKCNTLSFKSHQFDMKHETLLIRRLLNISQNWYIKNRQR